MKIDIVNFARHSKPKALRWMVGTQFPQWIQQPMPEAEPEPLDLLVGIEFGLFGTGDTGNDQAQPDDGYPYPPSFDGEDEDGYD